jgi:hypothetical protein
VNLSGEIPDNLVEDIIDSGMTSVSSRVDAAELMAVIEKYSLSVTQVFVSMPLSSRPSGPLINGKQYIPVVTPALSFLLLPGRKWISTKSKQAPATAMVLDEKIESDAEEGVVSASGEKLQPDK